MCSGLHQAKGKQEKFEHPKGGNDDCLGNVLGGQRNLERSNLEKIDEPATLDVKSVMLGNGYLLGLVRLFNQR